MDTQKWIVAAAVALGLTLGPSVERAEACGGCLVPTRTETQVVAHRMAMSISPTSSTLWDQIEYTGDPESFAWILPIKSSVAAPVTVGLSSDLLFETLEAFTQVTVIQPAPPSCPPHPCPNVFTATGTGIGSSTGTGTSTGVGVIVEQVVGPFETVQLSSDDPGALLDWLNLHGFAVPADIQPIISAYIDEGFDFLALRLVPGQGIDAMRPVRITTPGANLTLPLRMVAAGTGANTSVRLWVAGEGRYEPVNRPSLVIDHEAVVWDFATQSSNYAQLKQAAFAQAGGTGWLTSVSETFLAVEISYPILDWVTVDPFGSGYGDATGAGALAEAEADVAAFLGGLNQLRITRLDAELSRAGLVLDLDLGASSDQSGVSSVIVPTQSKNFECPVYPECPPNADDGDGVSDDEHFDPADGGFMGGNAEGDPLGDSSCAMGRGSFWDFAPPGLLLLFGAARLLAARPGERRRRRRG